MPEKTLDEFLETHKKMKRIADERGKAGQCISKEEWMAEVGITEEEWKHHIELFNIDEYETEAVTGVFCTRDAVREMAEMLKTAEK